MKEKLEKLVETIGQDGLLHILCSNLLVVAINLILPLWFAVVVTAIAGLGKELVWDKILGRGTCDKKDILCDIVGIIIGCL